MSTSIAFTVPKPPMSFIPHSMDVGTVMVFRISSSYELRVVLGFRYCVRLDGRVASFIASQLVANKLTDVTTDLEIDLNAKKKRPKLTIRVVSTRINSCSLGDSLIEAKMRSPNFVSPVLSFTLILLAGIKLVWAAFVPVLSALLSS